VQPVCVLGVYLLVVFSGGALLAPGLYWLIQCVAEQQAGWAKLAEIPFHRVVNRAILGLALVGLWPLLRELRIRTWKELGLGWHRGAWSGLGLGFGLGFVTLAGVALSALAAEARVLRVNYTFLGIWGQITTAALTGAAVGFLEELLFRGALFGALRKAGHWTVALAVSSAVYALVHFFQKPAATEQVVWYSGFVTLGAMLQGFVELDKLVPGFLVLTVAGAILAVCYHRTGSLYYSIGVHAGWVFWMKLNGAVTSTKAGASVWFWGSRKLYDGWLSFLVLTVVLAACMMFPSRKRPDEPTVT
jgi:membrane protease YdiL (CAAX protease family)